MEVIKYSLVILFNLLIFVIIGALFYATYDWLWVAHPVVPNLEPVPRDYYLELVIQLVMWFSDYHVKIPVGLWVALILYFLLSTLLWQATAVIGFPLWYKLDFSFEMHMYQQEVQEQIMLWLTRICLAITCAFGLIWGLLTISTIFVK